MPTYRSAGTRSWKSKSSVSNKCPVPGYKNVWSSFGQKIESYKTLFAQTTGAAKFHRPTPTTLNSFAKWVDKGAVVHKISPTQIKRWSKVNKTFTSPASAKIVLQKCFGKGVIKAVTGEKSGAFLVATAPIWKGKKFSFPR